MISDVRAIKPAIPTSPSVEPQAYPTLALYLASLLHWADVWLTVRSKNDGSQLLRCPSIVQRTNGEDHAQTDSHLRSSGCFSPSPASRPPTTDPTTEHEHRPDHQGLQCAPALVRRPGHGRRRDSLSVGVLWTGPNDGSLNGTTVTVAVVRPHPHQRPASPADRARPDPGRRSRRSSRRRHRQRPDEPHGREDPRLLQLPLGRRHDRLGRPADRAPAASPLHVKRTGPYDTVLDNTHDHARHECVDRLSPRPAPRADRLLRPEGRRGRRRRVLRERLLQGTGVRPDDRDVHRHARPRLAAPLRPAVVE